jgi:quercetin dioxygenase-like cupin family protein
MLHKKLSDMKMGWFIGNFSPTMYATEDVEVAIKNYPAGSSEAWHYHKIATEYTAIIKGDVMMNGQTYGEGDIIVMEKGEGTDFKALTDTTTVVVKTPGATNDKFTQIEP